MTIFKPKYLNIKFQHSMPMLATPNRPPTSWQAKLSQAKPR